MDERDPTCAFSLLGGPLHRLGLRLGLVRASSNSLPLGLALAVLTWTPLAILAVVQGAGDRLFSLSVVGAHVRLLAVVPLFFLCESWIDPPAAAFVRTLRGSRIVPDHAVPAFDRAVARARQLTNAWTAEAACLAVALAVSLYAVRLPISGSTAIFDADRALLHSAAGDWYWLVALPLFRFLVFRWLWRIGVWAWFLWRVATLGLDLRATHPDGVGGLACLEIVHARLAPLVFALSAVQAAALVEEFLAGSPFRVVYPVLGLVLAIDAVLVFGPLFVFAPALSASRMRSLADFTELGQRYVTAFDTRWIRPGTTPRPELLGNDDVQSLANLFDSVRVVRHMRVAPVGARLVRSIVIAAALPVVPLFLFEHPLLTLLEKILARLVGL